MNATLQHTQNRWTLHCNALTLCNVYNHSVSYKPDHLLKNAELFILHSLNMGTDKSHSPQTQSADLQDSAGCVQCQWSSSAPMAGGRKMTRQFQASTWQQLARFCMKLSWIPVTYSDYLRKKNLILKFWIHTYTNFSQIRSRLFMHSLSLHTVPCSFITNFPSPLSTHILA